MLLRVLFMLLLFTVYTGGVDVIGDGVVVAVNCVVYVVDVVSVVVIARVRVSLVLLLLSLLCMS